MNIAKGFVVPFNIHDKVKDQKFNLRGYTKNKPDIGPIIPHNNPESMSPFLERMKKRARMGADRETLEKLERWQSYKKEDQLLSLEERELLRKSL